MTKTPHKAVTIITSLVIGILLIIGLVVFISWWTNFRAEQKFHDALGNAQVDGEITIGRSTEFYDISAKIPVEPRDIKNVMKDNFEKIVHIKESQWAIGSDVYNSEMQINADFPDRSPMKYELNISYEKIESPKLGIVSYVFSTYEFTGGAHGNTDVTIYNFSPTGETVYFGSVFNRNVEDNNKNYVSFVVNTLAPALMNKLNDSSRETIYEGLLSCGSKSIEVNKSTNVPEVDFPCLVPQIEDIVIRDEGVEFVFPPYQVAPYSSGVVRVIIPWHDLSPYINSDFDLPLD